MPLGHSSLLGLKFQHKANRSQLFCGQFSPVFRYRKSWLDRNLQASSQRKQHASKHHLKTPFHKAKFLFSLSWGWRACPSIFLIFTAHYNTIISSKIKTEEAIAFYLLSTAMLLEIYYQLTTPQLQLLNNARMHAISAVLYSSTAQVLSL